MAETARVAVQVMAVTKAENNTRHEGTQNAGPKIGRPVIKQPYPTEKQKINTDNR